MKIGLKLNNTRLKIEVRCIRGKTLHEGAPVLVGFMWSLKCPKLVTITLWNDGLIVNLIFSHVF